MNSITVIDKTAINVYDRMDHRPICIYTRKGIEMSNPNYVHSAGARSYASRAIALTMIVILMIYLLFAFGGIPVNEPAEAEDAYGVEIELAPKSLDESQYTWYEPDATPNCIIRDDDVYEFVSYHSRLTMVVEWPKKSSCLTKPQAEELLRHLVAENTERINAHNEQLDAQVNELKASSDLHKIIAWLCSGGSDSQAYWASEITVHDATWAQLEAYQNHVSDRILAQLEGEETPFLYTVGKRGSATSELAEHIGTLLGTGPVLLSCDSIVPPAP